MRTARWRSSAGNVKCMCQLHSTTTEMLTRCTTDYVGGENLAMDRFRNLCVLRFLGGNLGLGGRVCREATGMHQCVQSGSSTASTEEGHCFRWLRVASTTESGLHRGGCATSVLPHASAFRLSQANASDIFTCSTPPRSKMIIVLSLDTPCQDFILIPP